MRKKRFYIIPILFSFVALITTTIKAQDHQDCSTAFQICDLDSYFIPTMKGTGLIKDDLSRLSCDDVLKETNSYWFAWEAKSSGIMTFVIQPNSEDDDIDFVLFKQSNDNCASKESIRCMMSGDNHGSRETQNLLCNGATGLSINSLDEFEKAGCAYNDDNYLKFLKVEKGDQYSLLVNNFESPNGFSITFEGDCSLKETLHCGREESSPFLSEVTLYPNPSDSELFVDFMSMDKRDVQFEIRDISGKLIKTRSEEVALGQNKFEFDLSTLNSGTYLMNISQNSYSIQKRFIKQ